MPSRFLKESICTSENIDMLTDFQETFFYRLMVNCDDFGRFDGRPKLLASRLYPLKDIPKEKIEDALQALQNADLITLYTANGHPYLYLNSWLDHQQKRSDKSKYPDPPANDCEQVIADDNKCYQMISDDNACNQTKADDSKCARIRIRNTYNDNRISLSSAHEDALIDDDDAREIQNDHDRVLDAAEDAGFKTSNSVRASLIRLYSQHGLDAVLSGIESCMKHGAPNIAYLEACLKGGPKKQKARSPTEKFPQRDYSDVPAQMAADLDAEVKAFLESGGA